MKASTVPVALLLFSLFILSSIKTTKLRTDLGNFKKAVLIFGSSDKKINIELKEKDLETNKRGLYMKINKKKFIEAIGEGENKIIKDYFEENKGTNSNYILEFTKIKTIEKKLEGDNYILTFTYKQEQLKRVIISLKKNLQKLADNIEIIFNKRIAEKNLTFNKIVKISYHDIKKVETSIMKAQIQITSIKSNENAWKLQGDICKIIDSKSTLINGVAECELEYDKIYSLKSNNPRRLTFGYKDINFQINDEEIVIFINNIKQNRIILENLENRVQNK
jgi:hypothetical protein